MVWSGGGGLLCPRRPATCSSRISPSPQVQRAKQQVPRRFPVTRETTEALRGDMTQGTRLTLGAERQLAHSEKKHKWL